MISEYRKIFNQQFSKTKNDALIHSIEQSAQMKFNFKVSESPIFLSRSFRNKIFEVSESIIEQIKSKSNDDLQLAIPNEYFVPNDNKNPEFLIFDYAICQNENLEIEPQLIELQAFPSLFAFMKLYEEKLIEIYPFLNALEKSLPKDEYISKLKQLIIGNKKAENVILLEIFPDKQKTFIDFQMTEKYLGIEIVCVTQIIKKGKKLFYEKNGQLIPIHRIYNRVIFDELFAIEHLKLNFDFREELEVEWVTHPNWFYKVSKYLLPQLKHSYIPQSFYLKDFTDFHNLDNYVLKPLFSFAGSGVNLHPSRGDLEEISDKENYILQKKVRYAALFEDINHEFSKAEIRLMYIWDSSDENPEYLINLVRMTKSDVANMGSIDKCQIWVGCSYALFDEGLT